MGLIARQKCSRAVTASPGVAAAVRRRDAGIAWMAQALPQFLEVLLVLIQQWIHHEAETVSRRPRPHRAREVAFPPPFVGDYPSIFMLHSPSFRDFDFFQFRLAAPLVSLRLLTI